MQGMQGHQLLLPHMMGQMNPMMHQMPQMLGNQQMLRQQMGLSPGELTSKTSPCSIFQKKTKTKNHFLFVFLSFSWKLYLLKPEIRLDIKNLMEIFLFISTPLYPIINWDEMKMFAHDKGFVIVIISKCSLASKSSVTNSPPALN